MKNLFKITLLVIAFTLPLANTATASQHNLIERNYFQFAIPKYHTSRQQGQTITVYVRYAYKQGLPTNQYPDYRVLRTEVLKYLDPSEQLPAEVFWEIIASDLGKKLMQDYPLDGISIQFTVLDNQDPNKYEPGNHGPIYTLGDIEPLNEPLALN